MNKIKGFTLIETLIAILALSLSIGSLTLITSRTLLRSRDAEARIQAEMLAVEGIEAIYAQYMSMQLATPGTDPLTNSSTFTACLSATGCAVEYNTLQNGSAFTSCGVPSDLACKLKLSNFTTYPDFTHTSGGNPLTQFSRIVYIKLNTGTEGGGAVRSIVWYGNTAPSAPNPTSLEKKVVVTRELRPWYVPAP
jgi:prepilin-type N-terminal cleavage/methylation domain-containing protein